MLKFINKGAFLIFVIKRPSFSNKIVRVNFFPCDETCLDLSNDRRYWCSCTKKEVTGFYPELVIPLSSIELL